jgi:hypothetical protein
MKKALVLSLAVVLGLGVASFAQVLSGSWDTTVTIVPSPVSLGIDSELIVTYAVSGWSFTSDTILDETGWLGQEFAVSGALGAFTLGSTLVFDPSAPAFTSWEVTGALSLAGVTFDGTFTLEPGVTYFEIVAAGTAGAVDVEADVTFGDGLGCNFNFGGVLITVGFPFCCADIVSTIEFDCAGFVEATFAVEGIAIPNLPWVSIDALLTFQTGSKTLVLTPSFDFGAIACFELYIDQAATGNLTLGDITIGGIGLSCEIGGVEFYGLSYWGTGDKPEILGTYWEMYQITTTDDGCCGPFDFTVQVFFDKAGLMLFDVAEIDASMSIQIATQFTFSTGIKILTAGPAAFTEWTLGFLVQW